jgi:hypothetical protein
VTNRLGSAVELLVLRDKDGRLFTAESIGEDATAALVPVEKESDVAKRLRDIHTDRSPQLPDSFPDRSRNTLFDQQNRSSYYYGQWNDAASRLQQRLDSMRQSVDSQTSRAVNLEDGAYLAITRQGVELSTGLVDPPQEEDSFHIVEGKW